MRVFKATLLGEESGGTFVAEYPAATAGKGLPSYQGNLMIAFETSSAATALGIYDTPPEWSTAKTQILRRLGGRGRSQPPEKQKTCHLLRNNRRGEMEASVAEIRDVRAEGIELQLSATSSGRDVLSRKVQIVRLRTLEGGEVHRLARLDLVYPVADGSNILFFTFLQKLSTENVLEFQGQG